MECRFWPEIRTKNQDGTQGNIFPVRPSKVHNLLKNNQTYLWYQYNLSLADNKINGAFKLGKTGRKTLKYPYMIDMKQWKELEKEGRKKGINTSDIKEVVPFER